MEDVTLEHWIRTSAILQVRSVTNIKKMVVALLNSLFPNYVFPILIQNAHLGFDC